MGQVTPRCWYIALLLVFTMIHSVVIAADGPVIHQQIDRPRDTGYMLGDQITHYLDIRIRKPYALVEDSLPKKGRVSDYVALNEIRVNRTRHWGAVNYQISFHYQVINYHNNLVGTMIPAAIVSFASRDDVYPVVLRPWGLTVSPYLLSGNRDAGEMPELLPLAPEPAIALFPRVLKAAALALLAVVFFIPAFQQYLLAPLRARARKPFHVAHKTIARLSTGNASDLTTASQAMHKAFNDTLDQTVLSADLDQLLSARPSLARHRPHIEHFFTWSDRYFYHLPEQQDTTEDSGFDLAGLKQLAARLKRCE